MKMISKTKIWTTMASMSAWRTSKVRIVIAEFPSNETHRNHSQLSTT